MLVYDLNEIKTTPFSKLTVFSHAAITHGHTFFEFTIVLEGSCNSSINNGPLQILKQGDMIFLRPGDIHMLHPLTKNYKHRDIYVTVDKMKQICDAFSDNFFQEILSPQLLLQYKLDINEFTLLEQKATALNSAISPGDDQRLDRIHTAIICQLLGVIVYQQQIFHENIPEWLNSLFLHLSSFHYVNYSIEEIIATTGYSHSYVCQKFKSTYGVTLLDCLNKSKIILSSNLLGKEKIIDIANSLGWENPKNYSIAFKKVFGITPRQYISAIKLNKDVPIISSVSFSAPPKIQQLSDLPSAKSPNKS